MLFPRPDDGAEVQISPPAGLAINQTDKFDTPYNEAIPEEFHRAMPNQWHVTTETVNQTEAVRIGAAMAVSCPYGNLQLEPLEKEGWFGARIEGGFGTIEGWIQLVPGVQGPEDYSTSVSEGKAIVCGTAADGDRFVV